MPKTQRPVRRAVERLTEYLTPEAVYERYILNMRLFPYLRGAKKLHSRDRAFISALYATGLRVSELLSVDRSQVEVTEKWLILRGIKIEKQKKLKLLSKGLPRKGRLAPFTEQFLDYYKSHRKPGKVFKFNRHTAYKIVKEATGQWPHYFRAQHLSYLANEVGLSTLNVKALSGHATVAQLEKYVKSNQEPFLQFEEQLQK